MSSECLGTRDAKKKAKMERYLAGRSRKTYSHTPVLSLRGIQISTSAGEGLSLSPEQREKYVCNVHLYLVDIRTFSTGLFTRDLP